MIWSVSKIVAGYVIFQETIGYAAFPGRFANSKPPRTARVRLISCWAGVRRLRAKNAIKNPRKKAMLFFKRRRSKPINTSRPNTNKMMMAMSMILVGSGMIIRFWVKKWGRGHRLSFDRRRTNKSGLPGSPGGRTGFLAIRFLQNHLV